MVHFRDVVYPNHRSGDFEIIAINEDSSQPAVALWLADNDIPFTALWDQSWSVINLFNLWGTTLWTNLIDRGGILRYSQYDIGHAELEILIDLYVPAEKGTWSSIKALW